MWELDHKGTWIPKNWCFWTVVLEKTINSPLDCKIKTVNPKGNQSWIFIGRTDTEAEAPILWPPEVKSQLIKDLMLRKIEAGGQGDDRRQDCWMASLTQWTWIWASPRRWWWTGKPGMLQPMGPQRARKDWATTGNLPEGSTYFSRLVGLWGSSWRNSKYLSDGQPRESGGGLLGICPFSSFSLILQWKPHFTLMKAQILNEIQ